MDEDRIRLTDAEARARRRRNMALGLLLAGLVVVFYFVSLAKMTHTTVGP